MNEIMTKLSGDSNEESHGKIQAMPLKVNLRDRALALIARLVLNRRDEQEKRPEEAFLLNQYEKCPVNGQDWIREYEEYLSSPEAEDIILITLVRHLNLAAVELFAIALSLGVEEDAMVGRSIAHVQAPVGGSRPTLGLLETVFAPVAGAGREENTGYLAGVIASGRAVQCGLLTVLNDAAPLPEQAVRVPVALALAMRGRGFHWPGASVGLTGHAVAMPPSIYNTAKDHGDSLIKSPDRVLVIRSTSPVEGKTLSLSIAGAIHREPIFIEPDKIELRGLGPLCFVRDLVPVFCYDLGPGEHHALPMIPGYSGPVLVVNGPDGTFEHPAGTVMTWEVPDPNCEERADLWQEYLPQGKQHHELANTLAKEHIHRPARIAELARLSMRQAELQKRTVPTREDISEAAWLSEGGGLGSLAQPIKEKIPDNALVVTEQLKKELHLLLERCHQRETLAKDLGVTLAARYQVGVRALMVGPSGTGKTLASGWLATHLGLPLYRVDLASVTSKYIGETEKNLSKLLARAEQDEVVLLFDEADSMFGKRTDIKDSNDRFANAQTNYLLQRIESYTGIVILTSNSRARFDSSFTRRIDMVIEFSSPGPEERRAIWLNHLGRYHSLTRGNINQLASQCDFNGGNIRNVVLTSAVMAKQAGIPIALEDTVIALTGEYRKLGKQMPPELMRIAERT
jgi:hypothetical protein